MFHLEPTPISLKVIKIVFCYNNNYKIKYKIWHTVLINFIDMSVRTPGKYDTFMKWATEGVKNQWLNKRKDN